MDFSRLLVPLSGFALIVTNYMGVLPGSFSLVWLQVGLVVFLTGVGFVTRVATGVIRRTKAGIDESSSAQPDEPRTGD